MFIKMKQFYICIIFVLIFINSVDCKGKDVLLKSSSELLEKELERLTTNRINCPVDLQLSHLDYARLNAKKEKTVSCLVRYLDVNKGQGWAWSCLGDVYQQLNLMSSASTCFKQAAKLDGSVTSFIRGFHFLGPFVIGKGEVDGDPVESFGGIRNVSRSRFSSGVKLYSELLSQGEVTWTVYPERKNTYIVLSPPINWGELVNSLGSTGIMEWQGWVVAEFAVNVNNLEVFIRCLGVHTVFVDDLPIVGDVYRREHFMFPVSLTRGMHTVYIQGRAKASLQVRCDVGVIPASQSFEILKPSFLPDFYDGRLFSKYISLPIANRHATKWLKIKKVTLEDFSPSADGVVVDVAVKDDKGFDVAPGQTRPITIELITEGVFLLNSCSKVELTLAIVTSLGSTEYTVTFRCRKIHESFLFTFVDHDGSLQHGAAIQPLEPCQGNLCPVVLTLHGTTVPPQNQADSYKRLVEDDFLFGLEKAWILAPTRHGAHNWEGPGALTAITALREFARMTLLHDWILDKASSEYAIFAGHSMGGHGAWHLATHFPDMALAVVSLAGWIKKEEYGDSNLFFRHDISNSYVAPRIKSILEDCITENEADRHVSNLKGVPVMMRIGAEDRTIHPYFNRRMCRLLKEWHINITYVELQGKDHWWWDSVEINDGGCVNDKQLRDFMNEHAVLPHLTNPNTEQQCDKLDAENAECGSASASGLYQQPETFTLSLTNTAFMGSVRGVLVLQQILPHHPTRVQVNAGLDKTVIKTENVRLFRLKSSGYRQLNWKRNLLQVQPLQQIDFSEFDLRHDSSPPGDGICFCLDTKDLSWSRCNVCDDLEGHGQRGPATVGPARRIAESRFIIITGTQSPREQHNKALEVLAVYIANLFYVTSDALAFVMQDKDLTPDISGDHNLIILGGPEENLYAQRFLDGVPLTVENGSIQLGKCRYSDPQTGALFLAPHSNMQRLALVLLGNSLEGLKDVVSFAAPTIPPMTRSPFSNMIPDFIITGPTYRSHGPGGYQCTGFWDHRWDLRPELVSCSYCL